MTAPHKTKLPKTGLFTLKCDTTVDGSDLDRFVAAGGKIDTEGYKLYINGMLTVPPSTEITGASLDGNGGRGSGVVLIPNRKDKPCR